MYVTLEKHLCEDGLGELKVLCEVNDSDKKLLLESCL